MSCNNRSVPALAILCWQWVWVSPTRTCSDGEVEGDEDPESDDEGGANSLAFSSHGKRLASASSDKKVGLWEAAGGKHIKFLEGDHGRVYSVAFSPDGTTIAAGGENQVVTWDAGNPNIRGAVDDLPPDGSGSTVPKVLSLAYSPKGALMAAGYGISPTIPSSLTKCTANA